MTSTGKIDRKSLFENVQQDKNENTDASRLTESEKELMEIWEKVLGLVEMNPMHTIFDLGGNSLLVLKLISEIKNKYGFEPNFRDFFNQSFKQFSNNLFSKVKAKDIAL